MVLLSSLRYGQIDAEGQYSREAKTLRAVHREGDWYVAWCPELDVASQGRTVEAALANLREAVELFLEGEETEFPEERFLLTTIEVEDAQAARPVRS